MKIIVTGALGHIGSRLVRQIPTLFPGTETVMIDNMLTQRYCSLFNLPARGRYRFIEADILKMDLNAIVDGGDVVVQLAALTDAASSFHHRAQVETVNYNATLKVAQACAAAGCAMIHVSSTSVYGTQREVVDEQCSEEELRPQSPYAQTKLREERFLKRMAASEGLRFVTCRFGTICGISEGMRFHTAVNKFCFQAVMGQPLTIWRTALHQKRPYLTLDDAIQAFTFIIEHELFDGNIYNVLTANLTVHDIITAIKKQVVDFDIEYVDTEIMNQLSYEVLNRRFIEQGFEFTGCIEKSIQETIELLGTAGALHVRKNSLDS
jgi:nucleoside-diphosphate-sugar epimerase